MKTKALTAALVFTILACGGSSGLAFDDDHGSAVAADVVIGRPMCLVATVLGSALFVLSLPLAATSKSVRKSAHVLVARPAAATFTRPLGDFDDLDEY